MNSFEESLHAFMDDMEVEKLDIRDEEGFVISSKEQANYFIRKIKEFKEQKEQIALTAKLELERLKDDIEKWQELETNKIDNEIEHCLSLIQPFLDQMQLRSLKLPAGTVGYRRQQPHFNYNDDIDLLQISNIDPELIKAKTSYILDKVALKKAGEIIDGEFYLDGTKINGITVEILPDKFDVR